MCTVWCYWLIYKLYTRNECSHTSTYDHGAHTKCMQREVTRERDWGGMIKRPIFSWYEFLTNRHILVANLLRFPAKTSLSYPWGTLIPNPLQHSSETVQSGCVVYMWEFYFKYKCRNMVHSSFSCSKHLSLLLSLFSPLSSLSSVILLSPIAHRHSTVCWNKDGLSGGVSRHSFPFSTT